MIRFFFVWGLLLWLVSMLVFRFAGEPLLEGENMLFLLLTLLFTVLLVSATTYPVYIWRRVPGRDRPGAAIAIALPGLLLNVLVILLFPTIFANLEPTALIYFMVWLLWAYGLVLLTGIFPRLGIRPRSGAPVRGAVNAPTAAGATDRDAERP